jgi:hypothetical protein
VPKFGGFTAMYSRAIDANALFAPTISFLNYPLSMTKIRTLICRCARMRLTPRAAQPPEMGTFVEISRRMHRRAAQTCSGGSTETSSQSAILTFVESLPPVGESNSIYADTTVLAPVLPSGRR